MRLEKKAIIDEIRGRLEQSEYAILVGCRGLTVEQMTSLRAKLREGGARLQVVRNTLFGIAAQEAGWDGLTPLLEGPTAMVCGAADVARTARILKEFVRENARLVLKGGRMPDGVLRAQDVVAIAEIPPRPVLLGQLVGVLAAPLSQLVGAMNQKVASLLYVLKAVGEQKGQ